MIKIPDVLNAPGRVVACVPFVLHEEIIKEIPIIICFVLCSIEVIPGHKYLYQHQSNIYRMKVAFLFP